MAKRTSTKTKTKDTVDTSMEAAQLAIKKQFGDGAITFLKDYEEEPREVIKTGILGLDFALGVGGLTKGNMVEFFGPSGGGKTTAALSVCVEAQRKNPNEKIIFVDAEKSFNKELALNMGLDEARTVIVDAHSAEENLMIAETLIKTGEFGVCVVDSVAALTPREEYEANLDSMFIGLHARLMSKMCRNFTPVLSDTSTLFVLINQIRFKIGQYGDPTTTTGGNSIPFYCDVRIKVTSSHSKSKLLQDHKGNYTGQSVTFEVIKNKLAPPFRKAEADLIFGRGFDTLGELVDLGEQTGLVTRSGSWFEYEGLRVQGKDRLREALSGETEKRNKLSKEISEVLFG